MATYNESKRKSDAYRSEGYKPFNWEPYKGGPRKVKIGKNLQANNQCTDALDGDTDAPKVGKTKDVTNRDMTCKGKYY